MEMNQKKLWIAYLLWLLTGLVGGHRYYMGDRQKAILMSCTLGGLGILFVLDAFWLQSRIQEINEKIALENTARFKQYEIKFILKWIGENPSASQKQMLDKYRDTFIYLSKHIHSAEERILKAISTKFDEIEGILVATDQRLIFSYVKDYNPTIHAWSYLEVKGLSIATNAMGYYELLMELADSQMVFKEIKNNPDFEQFIRSVGDERNKRRLSRISHRQVEKPMLALEQMKPLELPLRKPSLDNASIKEQFQLVRQ